MKLSNHAHIALIISSYSDVQKQIFKYCEYSNTNSQRKNYYKKGGQKMSAFLYKVTNNPYRASKNSC